MIKYKGITIPKDLTCPQLWAKGSVNLSDLRIIYPNGLVQTSYVSWKKKERLQWNNKSCTSAKTMLKAIIKSIDYEEFYNSKPIFIGYIKGD